MSTRQPAFRQSQFEYVEPRRLMASDLQTAATGNDNATPSVSVPTAQVYLRATAANQSSDVNSDGLINHRDAHAVASFLNSRSAGGLGAEGEVASANAANLDTNGDGVVSPNDIMWVVNKIKEYDPLTPCNCGACTQPSGEGRCENASIAAAQSASFMIQQAAGPAGEFVGPIDSSLLAAQSIDAFLRERDNAS